MNKLVDIVNYFNGVSRNMRFDMPIIENEAYESVIGNINKFPHGIIFMAVADQNDNDGQLEALPFRYLEANGDFSFELLSRLSFDELFDNISKTRLNIDSEQINLIYKAIQYIKNMFNSNPASIWNDCPSSYVLKQRLMSFEGMNSEKANVIALLLIQKFDIKLADNKDITISYDNNILTTMKRIGLIDTVNKSYEEIKFIARKINPDFPGIFDNFFYVMGKYIASNGSNDAILDGSKEILIADCIEAVEQLRTQGIL